MMELLYKIVICLILKYFNMKKEKMYQFYALSASDSPQNYRYVGVTSTSISVRFS